MLITLDLDADLVDAARELAQRSDKSIDQVISELARDGLVRRATTAELDAVSFYGFTPLPADGVTVTNELINALRDAAGD